MLLSSGNSANNTDVQQKSCKLQKSFPQICLSQNFRGRMALSEGLL